MKIISYNVNGIRAVLNKDFIQWLQLSNPDVLCIQESKAALDQINQKLFEEIGYQSFWFPAERKGYSGVGIITKLKPKNVIYGCGIEKFDAEGRVIRLDFEELSVLSVYVPSGSNINRLGYKLDFCRDFLEYIKNLETCIPNLVISGDFNICHEAIDIHDPVRLQHVSGFLPVEREWMTDFIKECQLIDSFRYMNPNPGNYTWWSYRQNSRARNKGWRIDYNFITQSLQPFLKRSIILKDVVHSDHCPILIEV